MAYTEFCCRAGGSNLNAGSRNGSSTEPERRQIFSMHLGLGLPRQVCSLLPLGTRCRTEFKSGISLPSMPMVRLELVFVGRVSAVDATTITIHATARMGTAPTDGTLNRTLRIGGAWQGPVNVAGTEAWPFNRVGIMLRNLADNPVRINFKNDQSIGN